MIFDVISTAQLTVRSDGVCTVQYVTCNIGGGEITARHSDMADDSQINDVITKVILAFAAE